MREQLESLFDTLQSLSPSTLVQIIDEAGCEIVDNGYKEMATDIYNKAKAGKWLSHKQKRVLVNIIGG